MESIIVAVITGGLALVGVIFSNMSSNNQLENRLLQAQAVTDTKLENLTEEVRKHNSFAERIPKIETRIESLEKRIDKMEAKQ